MAPLAGGRAIQYYRGRVRLVPRVSAHHLRNRNIDGSDHGRDNTGSVVRVRDSVGLVATPTAPIRAMSFWACGTLPSRIACASRILA